MKRISLLLLSFLLLGAWGLPAQDAATQERLDKLSGQIEDLIASQRAQQKQIEALAREVATLREQAGKHTGDYATREEAQRLAEAISKVDRARIEDSERVTSQLEKIRKSLVGSLASPPRPVQEPKKPANEKGYTYVVQPSDTLSAIVQAYRDKNIKVSIDQVLKANPGLKPEKLKVGQEIRIPAP